MCLIILCISYIMKIFNIYVKKKNDGLRVDLWVFCEKSIFRPSRSDSFLFISTVAKVRVSTNPQIPSNIQKIKYSDSYLWVIVIHMFNCFNFYRIIAVICLCHRAIVKFQNFFIAFGTRIMIRKCCHPMVPTLKALRLY